MKIKRVEHIAIAVNALAPSIDLLRNTFGLTLEYEEQIGQTRLAMLPVGETYIELLEGQGPESGVTRWIGEKAASAAPEAPKDAEASAGEKQRVARGPAKKARKRYFRRPPAAQPQPLQPLQPLFSLFE